MQEILIFNWIDLQQNVQKYKLLGYKSKCKQQVLLTIRLR